MEYDTIFAAVLDHVDDLFMVGRESGLLIFGVLGRNIAGLCLNAQLSCGVGEIALGCGHFLAAGSGGAIFDNVDGGLRLSIVLSLAAAACEHGSCHEYSCCKCHYSFSHSEITFLFIVLFLF